MHWRRKWQPAAVPLPGKIRAWTEEPDRLQSTGSQKMFYFLKMFISLVISFALGLCCCVLVFPSYDEWGPLSSGGAKASHCGGFCFAEDRL